MASCTCARSIPTRVNAWTSAGAPPGADRITHPNTPGMRLIAASRSSRFTPSFRPGRIPARRIGQKKGPATGPSQQNAPAEPSSRPKPVYNSTGALRTLVTSQAGGQDPEPTFLRVSARKLRALWARRPERRRKAPFVRLLLPLSLWQDSQRSAEGASGSGRRREKNGPDGSTEKHCRDGSLW